MIGDLELFVRERRAQKFHVPLIAITGTNGKSTTTALTAHILREAGRDAQVGGNIGTAMLSLEEFAPGRHYVIECSSYQIDLAPSIDPTRRRAAQRDARPSRPPRHHRELRGREGAAGRRAPSAPSSASTTRYCRAIADGLRDTKGADAVLRISARPDADCDIGVDGTKVVAAARRQPSPRSPISPASDRCAARTMPRTPVPPAAALLSLPDPLPAADIARCLKTFPGPRPSHGGARPPGAHAVRQRQQGDQRRFHRKGAPLVPRRHLLDPRRQAEGRRHREPRRALPARRARPT